MQHLRSIMQRFARSWPPVLGVILLFAGCASVPRPALELGNAAQAIEQARAASAERDAPLDWRFALSAMAAATLAYQQGKYDSAKQLSERAQIHAELARVKARAAQARSDVQASEAENQQLREQLKDASGKIR